MNQVLLYLPFRNPQHPGQLLGGQPSLGQEIDHALTQGAFRRQHAGMVSIRPSKCQIALVGSSFDGLVVKGCTSGSILSKSVPASSVTSRITRWAGLAVRIPGPVYRLSVP